MRADRPSEPAPDGPAPRLRPARPISSIQQFESPDDAAEAQLMADQRADPRPADQHAGDPPPGGAPRGAGGRVQPSRGRARVRPAAPGGAAADLQTTTGVPARPIPGAEPVPSSVEPAEGPTAAAAAEPVASSTARPDEETVVIRIAAPGDQTTTPDDGTAAVGDGSTQPGAATTTPGDGSDQASAATTTSGDGSDQASAATTTSGDGSGEAGATPIAPGHETTAPNGGTAEPGAAATGPGEETVAVARAATAAGGAVTTAPGEKTVRITPGEQTVVVRTTAPGEQTVVVRTTAPGEQTVVVRTGAPGEQTVAIAPPAGTEDTVVVDPARGTGVAALQIVRVDDTVVIPVVRPVPEPVPQPQPQPVSKPGALTVPVVVPGRTAGSTPPSPPAAREQAARDQAARDQAAAERRRGQRLERRRTPRGGPWELGHAPLVLLLSSLGVLLVAVAYHGGRTEAAGSSVAYWVGQVVVFTPVVLRLLSRRMAGVAESFLLVMGLAINQYLLKWMYSPDQFRFPDELQHWLGTTVLLETGKLFQPNPALPPAVHFPGLAEMGAAVASLTGLPVTAAGTLVAGVAHLVFVGILFAVVLRTSNSPAVAGVACATYATALHYLFFNSMFLYQTAALPFFMLAIWANRRWREGAGWPFALLTVVAIGGTTVSHHVSAFVLIATLWLLGLSEVATARPRRWAALIMPGVAVVVVAAWVLLVARDVIGYLEAPIDQVADTVSRLLSSGADESTAAPSVSLVQLGLQGAGLVALFVLYLAVARDMVMRRDTDDWRWAALLGGAAFFAGNGVRFLGQNGPEIAGRLSTFTYVPISIIAAIALVRAVQIIPERDADGRRWWVSPALNVPPPTGRHLALRVVAGSVMMTVLMIGARAGGWPPIASLLPGPYLAGGFERSVDAYGVDAAHWQRRVLGPGNRVGGDVTAVSLSSTYGRQDPVREVGSLYYSTAWSLADEQTVADLYVNYLVVDRRLGTQLPVSRAYFQDDPMAGRITTPLSATQLGKFDTIAGVDRLYDNGTVRVYRMGTR